MKMEVAGVTPVKCVDGKRHKWVDISLWDSWCSKCGCMTEFCRVHSGERKKRRTDFTGELVLIIPNFLYRKK